MKILTRTWSAEFSFWNGMQVFFIAAILLVTGCAEQMRRAELAPPPPFMEERQISLAPMESIEPAAGDIPAPPFLKKCLQSEGLERTGPLGWSWNSNNFGIGFSSSALHKTDSAEAIFYFSTSISPGMEKTCR